MTVWAQLQAKEFMLESDSFTDKSQIPAKYANYGAENGENISPELHWKNQPEGVKSYAIVCIDTAPIANNWVHWAVFNIPANVTNLNEGASCNNMPKGSIEAINSFVTKGYGGRSRLKEAVSTLMCLLFTLSTRQILDV